MAKEKKLSDDDKAYAESEKALPMGSGVAHSGKGSAAPAQLPPDQERQAEILGKQDAARELERRGLKAPPVVETNLSADFSKVKPPPGMTPAPAEPPRLLAADEKRIIREAGFNPVTGQILDPDRYARWVATHDGQALPGLPETASETGWWYVKPKLPAPQPCPQDRVEAPTAEAAKKAYCLKFGMGYPNPGVEWDIKPALKPEAVP